jgi:hypothetical protein
MICISRKPFFYCPSHLDLPTSLRASGEGKWAEDDLWRLYYIMWVIYRARWSGDREQFVSLNGKVLQRVLNSRKAKPALEVLLRLKIIETDNYYRVGRHGEGGKSRGYRFTSVYNEVRFRLVKELDYSRISQRLLREEEREASKLSPAHAYLFECLKRVTIQKDARDVMDASLDVWSAFQEDFYERSIELIETKQWYLNVGPQVGRVFTNVTNLPRKLRPYLRLDGRPLAEIDISACQPMLLSELYPVGSSEKEKYLELLVTGKFYETLDAQLGKPYGPERRDELKRAVLTQVCFDKLRAEQGRLCKAFAAMFPELYAQIVQFKTPNHKALAQRLQRGEADIVIHDFVANVAQTSGLPVLTIHDSVLTFPEHTNAVVVGLMRAVHRRVGVIPNIKDKDYSKDAIQEILLEKERARNWKDTLSEFPDEYPVFKRRKRGYSVEWREARLTSDAE